MAQRTVLIPDIGEVLLSKRRGAKYIRLSITPTGKIRVGMPYWTPYAAGIAFARKRKSWIHKNMALKPLVALYDGARVGKSHTLQFHPGDGVTSVKSKLSQNTINIYTDLPYTDAIVQDKALAASEKALLKEAKTLLPQRIESLAKKHGYTYKTLRIRKLTSRWGSCSSNQVISLSYFLVQLPWYLIDYVLLHELAHTRYFNHGREFWDAMLDMQPEAKKLQKEIKAYNPRIEVL